MSSVPQGIRVKRDLQDFPILPLPSAGIDYEGPPGMGPIEERIRELRYLEVRPEIPEDDELKGRASL